MLARLCMPERGVSTSSMLSIPVSGIASCRIVKYNKFVHESPRASWKLQRMCASVDRSPPKLPGFEHDISWAFLQYAILQNCRSHRISFIRGVEFMLSFVVKHADVGCWLSFTAEMEVTAYRWGLNLIRILLKD